MMPTRHLSPLLATMAVAAVAVLSAGVATATAAIGTVADFEARFHDETLRVDYYVAGDATETAVSLDQVYRQGSWAGSRTRLIDELDLGGRYHHLVDHATGELLYSRGFSSYFGEYRTTGPAHEGQWRTYHESALLPCPRAPADFVLLVRQEDGSLAEIFRTTIDPEHPTVRREPLAEDVIVVTAHASGDPHGKVDVAILGEGYTREQVGKFVADLQHFAGVLLQVEPFASHADQFNIRGVLAVSQDPGCDEPSRGVFAHTALGCTFDSLGSERYLLTEETRAVRDVAAHVPYDALYIMVNHERYGGGGIYNFYNTFTTDNQWSDYVFVHEFGHHFAALADEYYSSSVAYEDFYGEAEPRERNITRLRDPEQLKWGDLATPGVALPTPWAKEGYDERDRSYQRQRGAINDRIAELMTGGAATDEIAAAKAEGEELSRRHQEWVDAYFARSEYRGVVGAFEGAGYQSEGMYRSELDCIMFTKGLKGFCAACTRGIEQVIARYLE
jgi:hypothetical protein